MNQILVLFIFFIHFSLIGQEQFILHIEPERNECKNTELKSTTWTINGTEIKYKKGTYCIPLNYNGTFDSIQQNTIRETTHFQFNQKRTKYKTIVEVDTLSQLTMTKFKKDHHYQLIQTPSGNFKFFALDIIDTNHQIVLTIKNNNRPDNLYLHLNHEETIQINNDTTICLNILTQSIKNDPLVTLFLDNKEKLVAGLSSGLKYETIFNLNYLILHNEKTSMTIDLLTNKIYLD